MHSIIAATIDSAAAPDAKKTATAAAIVAMTASVAATIGLPNSASRQLLVPLHLDSAADTCPGSLDQQ